MRAVQLILYPGVVLRGLLEALLDAAELRIQVRLRSNHMHAERYP